jgi:hypothetical protein
MHMPLQLLPQFEYVASYVFQEKFTMNILKVTSLIEKVLAFYISYPDP